MSVVRKGNVALSNLRNSPVALSNLRNSPARMSLRPEKGRVALSILGVHTPFKGTEARKYPDFD